jgi:hypothetical protein
MSHSFRRPRGAGPPSRQVLAANGKVAAGWERLLKELPEEEMAQCYDDLANHAYPQYPDGRHHGPVKDLQDFVDRPAWERRLAGGSHVVFYRRGEHGPVLVYAGKREW